MNTRPGDRGDDQISQAWPAPAKLNLFLHVTGRRADGFHELQTVFQFIDWYDELRFRVRPDPVIRRTRGASGVAPEEDLAVCAARVLQATCGLCRGVDIDVVKHLPLGGGLGGGSSDAATTLVALNRLWELNLSVAELAELGLTLGADVPVFVHGRAAWAEGVGERLQAVELPEPWYVVVNPLCRVPTAEVFGEPDLTRDCPPITIRHFLSGRAENVLEPIVTARYPEVAAALQWLSSFAPARMSGAGSCVFAAFESEAHARDVVDRLPEAWQGFVARGMNRSPLLGFVNGFG